MAMVLANQLINYAMKTGLKENTDLLVKSLSRFDYPDFNRQPATGGWTAGEVAEHLLLFDIRLNEILRGRTVPTERDPQEKIEAIVSRMADTGTRLEAPAILVPSNTPKDPKALLEKIIAERARLIQVCRDQDLGLEYPDTPHRFFGPLTGIEWINFLVHHTGRHLQQLDRLYALHG